MKHKIFTTALFLAFFTTAWASPADSLYAAIETNNIALRLARTQGIRAVLELKAQNGLDNTEVEYSPFFTRGVSGLSSSELIVSQAFDLPWAYASRSRLAGKQSSANDAAYAALRQDILLQARNLVIEMDGLHKAIAVADRRLAIADSLIAAYETMQDNGGATALDLNLCKIERMGVAKESIELHTAMAKATNALTALNGGQPLPTLPTGIMDAAVLAPAGADSRIAAANAAIEAARQRERVARAESLPRLTLGYRRNTDTEVQQNGLLIGASLPLFGNAKRRTVARREREEAELNMQLTANEVALERANLTAELQQAEQILESSDPSLIIIALAQLHKTFHEGHISLLEYNQQSIPLYGQLQSIIATRTVYLQTLSTLNRNEL